MFSCATRTALNLRQRKRYADDGKLEYPERHVHALRRNDHLVIEEPEPDGFREQHNDGGKSEEDDERNVEDPVDTIPVTAPDLKVMLRDAAPANDPFRNANIATTPPSTALRP